MSGRQSRKNTGLIGSILWLTNIFVAIALLASYLSSYVDPGLTSVFAFLGLAYLILLLLNLIFLLYWLIRGKRKLLLSLIILLIGYQPFMAHFQLLPGREAPKDAVFSVLSYNVQNMAHSNLGVEKAEIRNGIYTFLSDQECDIVCIQEFSAKGSDFEYVFDNMKALTQYKYCYYENYNPNKTYRIDALVILSQYPIIASNSLTLAGNDHRFGIYADLLIGFDTIRVYNLHLESIRLQHEDYQFVEDVSKGQTETGSFSSGSKSILRKLHNAFKIRSKQTEVVISSLDSCSYPIILCGDFNDTPLSYAYHKISAGLEDAFIDAGHGLGNTFAGNLPPVRIDFILYSPDFRSFEFNVHRIPLSDHYPVSVFLQKWD